MATITVHRPDIGETAAPAVQLATRGRPPAGARLAVIDNGKPGGKALMTRMVERVRDRLRLGEVEVHTKPSAGKPLDADVTRMLAARSHLVVAGLGD